MINRIIEFSMKETRLADFWPVYAALAYGDIWAMVHTPIDAIPDLSENQVIVFTELARAQSAGSGKIRLPIR